MEDKTIYDPIEEDLKRQAEKLPKLFIQYDGFNPATHPVGPDSEDDDGDEIFAGVTYCECRARASACCCRWTRSPRLRRFA